MISSALPEGALRELGHTAGGPDTLALLVRDQHTRRLLLLRAVLDAVEAADATVCPTSVRARLREDWALLEAADGTGAGGGGTGMWPGAGIRGSAALDRLLYPLVGPWARSCLRLLDGAGVDGACTPLEERVRLLARELTHFSAVAAAAAVRAGVSFAVRLKARDGLLVLPSLGALRTVEPGDAPVELAFKEGQMTFRQPGAADVVVRWGRDTTTTWSDARAWSAARTLPGLVPGGAPVPLDDLDPYRTSSRELRHRDLSGPAVVDAAQGARWLRSWSGTGALLRLGGEHRLTEVGALLRSLVPLAVPVAVRTPLVPRTHGIGSCSGTRREAFGAVLSSTPPTPAALATTLVHEIQHAKFAALCEMVELHHAGPERRYFAPWRPDPRPYDALLHGTYSHLALADFFQHCALAATVGPAQRDSAWKRYARHREQVRAALPSIDASDALTPSGRLLVDTLIEVGTRLDTNPPPREAREEAEHFVDRTRETWVRTHALVTG
ncbi:HEXXH motif-containing putative peptide modification protein [Streptomyces sp. MBT62]|uniref:aKG-HExxH-type peptide beta-hydroxylase n=1 Tax=Streptomyces sp. MBT62 TaxID=2800410 RepID=UPI00190BB679|nr:HEXXH motif-containing putative peptide modification protein [Streptomyces sp. MBT62]MBK3565791.1 HEXXH motif domain-containing protein [Streptomyces sp. MBT62]